MTTSNASTTALANKPAIACSSRSAHACGGCCGCKIPPPAWEALSTLRQLKDRGIGIAVDDFGTGCSSLSYLKRLPVDTLKIDRSFVDGLGQDPQDSAIVRSVVSLAKTLSLTVTGEGVETTAQKQELRALGCDRGQGFLFARPQSAADLETYLGGPVRVGRAA